MRVDSIEAIPISVPVETAYETSLSLSTGSAETYDHVLVLVETDAGEIGVGEVAPMAAWPHGLTQVAVTELVSETLAPLVEGSRLDRIPRLVERLEGELSGEPFPICGIDVALYDALGKSRDLPVYDLLGGPNGNDPTIDLHYSIGIKSPQSVREEAQSAWESGFSDFKIKVGGPEFERELEAVKALAAAVPDARIRVDANQGWSAPEAIRRIGLLNDAADGLVLVEQPVPYDDIRGLTRVREAVWPPILADEACFSLRDVAMLARRDACDVINIKLGKTGGLTRARDVATVADAHGMPCFMGSMLELGVGAAANAHFAASCPAITYPTGALNVHSEDTLVEERETWSPTGDSFELPNEPGLGVTLDDEAVERYRVD